MTVHCFITESLSLAALIIQYDLYNVEGDVKQQIISLTIIVSYVYFVDERCVIKWYSPSVSGRGYHVRWYTVSDSVWRP